MGSPPRASPEQTAPTRQPGLPLRAAQSGRWQVPLTQSRPTPQSPRPEQALPSLTVPVGAQTLVPLPLGRQRCPLPQLLLKKEVHSLGWQ